MVVCAVVLAMAAPAAFAEEHGAAASQPTPDITVILGTTGGAVTKANVYLDGTLAGTTDSKGNFTFKEAPAAGNHTITVSGKGIKNSTIEADLAHKPVMVKAEASKGKALNVHVTDRSSGQGLADASLYLHKYLVGKTDANGDLKMADFPMGIYLVKLEKEGYRTTTTLLIVLSDRKQSFALSPLATHE